MMKQERTQASRARLAPKATGSADGTPFFATGSGIHAPPWNDAGLDPRHAHERASGKSFREKVISFRGPARCAAPAADLTRAPAPQTAVGWSAEPGRPPI